MLVTDIYTVPIQPRSVVVGTCSTFPVQRVKQGQWDGSSGLKASVFGSLPLGPVDFWGSGIDFVMIMAALLAGQCLELGWVFRMLLYLLCVMAGTPYYFSNATVYDETLHSLRDGVYLLVDDEGRVTSKSMSPIPVSEKVTELKGALILPHYSDFYNLIQERGLGTDEDMDLLNQARMARYLRRIGVQTFRDPVFPPVGLSPVMDELLDIRAARGYLEVEEGPGAEFCRVIKTTDPLEVVAEMIDKQAPVTFWWTQYGLGKKVLWPEQEERLRGLIQLFKARGQKVGAFIQDAEAKELSLLDKFDFDFYEGVPAHSADVEHWPDIVWVPLASLNDKRYCAAFFEERLAGMEGLGLYDEQERIRAQGVVANAKERIRDRCGSWRGQRESIMAPLRKWLVSGKKIGLGSNGGHLFSFSGDLRSELMVLDELGATQAQLLKAAFETTPQLLGVAAFSLKVGDLADFIVYKESGLWMDQMGRAVQLNFVEGNNVLAVPAGLSLKR